MNTLQQAFSNISGGRVLDVATGNGNFGGALMENLRDYSEIIGIDTNTHALDAGRENFKQDNIRFQSMDAAHLNFPDARFDTVCIAYSLRHLANSRTSWANSSTRSSMCLIRHSFGSTNL